jgi:hypothetical protein
MPSVHDHSAGTPAISTPRSAAPENTGNDAGLAVLVAESQRAADQLLAMIDWPAHDAALAQLMDQQQRQFDAYAAREGLAAHPAEGLNQ